MQSAISIMNIQDLEFMIPTHAHELGSISFKVEAGIGFSPEMLKIKESEAFNVELSEETKNKLQELINLIIVDLTK